MILETKANPGDIVYYMKDSTLHSSEVKAIQVRVAVPDFEPKAIGSIPNPFPKHTIGVCYYTEHGRLNESQIFRSKEEIAEAILNDTFNDTNKQKTTKQNVSQPTI